MPLELLPRGLFFFNQRFWSEAVRSCWAPRTPHPLLQRPLRGTVTPRHSVAEIWLVQVEMAVGVNYTLNLEVFVGKENVKYLVSNSYTEYMLK